MGSRGKGSKRKCRSGSTARDLDMCEGDALRGDEISQEKRENTEDQGPLGAGYRTDMSERDREGDEESGDEHSSGYQGDDIGPNPFGSEEEAA
jgi:hypothetical protein